MLIGHILKYICMSRVSLNQLQLFQISTTWTKLMYGSIFNIKVQVMKPRNFILVGGYKFRIKCKRFRSTDFGCRYFRFNTGMESYITTQELLSKALNINNINNPSNRQHQHGHYFVILRTVMGIIELTNQKL